MTAPPPSTTKTEFWFLLPIVNAAPAGAGVAAHTSHDVRKVVCTTISTVWTIHTLPIMDMRKSGWGCRLRRRNHWNVLSEIILLPPRTQACLPAQAAKVTELMAAATSMRVRKYAMDIEVKTYVMWKHPTANSTMFLHLVHCCHLPRFARSMSRLT